jgi:hypothetical protein
MLLNLQNPTHLGASDSFCARPIGGRRPMALIERSRAHMRLWVRVARVRAASFDQRRRAAQPRADRPDVEKRINPRNPRNPRLELPR